MRMEVKTNASGCPADAQRSAGAGVHVKVLENAVLAVLAVVGALKAPRVQAGHEDEVVLSWNVVSKPPPLERGSGRNRFTSTKKTAIARPGARPMRAVSWMGSRTQEPTCSQTPAESKCVHTRSSHRVHMRQPTCSQTPPTNTCTDAGIDQPVHLHCPPANLSAWHGQTNLFTNVFTDAPRRAHPTCSHTCQRRSRSQPLQSSLDHVAVVDLWRDHSHLHVHFPCPFPLLPFLPLTPWSGSASESELGGEEGGLPLDQ